MVNNKDNRKRNNITQLYKKKLKLKIWERNSKNKTKLDSRMMGSSQVLSSELFIAHKMWQSLHKRLLGGDKIHTKDF